MRIFLGLLALAGLAMAQTRPTIFLITDAEGVGGVCRQDQVEPSNREMQQLLTAEINAAVEGFYKGGAGEVIVWDGHDGSQTLSTLTIHPRAKLVMGGLSPSMLMERRFDAVAIVGQHSKANIRAGIMAHSYSSLGIQTMKLNNKAVGEIDVIAAMAGHFNTPVIMLSGDKAAVEEMREIVPDAEFAAVKEGLARYVCISESAKRSQEMIEQAAMRSVAKIGKIKPYRVPGPCTLEIEYTTRNSLPIGSELRTWAEVLDDRTIRFRGKDVLEVWQRYRVR
ncbi:MAG: M55 family metallopeptidase [Bryobacterales bacterium]|nr:M55 family metallopeptidase [Bryobacterales bacterium]